MKKCKELTKAQAKIIRKAVLEAAKRFNEATDKKKFLRVEIKKIEELKKKGDN